MMARSGGLFVGSPQASAGLRILSEALDLYPGARICVAGRGDARLRMQRAAYLVAPWLGEEEAELQPLMMAFAQALPVIASRTPAFAERIEPGRNGLLFEPGSARDLARRLAWADAFPEKMRQMGQCAQADYNARFVADWNWQRLYGGERRRQARLNP
jgi:glycosyltransferase involved in cell wall biosynthesis